MATDDACGTGEMPAAGGSDRRTPPAPGPWRLSVVGGWRLLVAQVCVLAVAAIGLLVFGWASAGLNTYLTVVDPRGGSTPGRSMDLTWAVIVGGLLLALFAAAGLPRSTRASTVDRGRASGGAGGAVVQFVGGSVVVGGTLLAYLVTHPYTFGGPDTPCTYASCWPLRPQALALTAPGLAAGLALTLMGFLANRIPWRLRALVPPALWLTLLLLQNAIWDAYLLPIFQGPAH